MKRSIAHITYCLTVLCMVALLTACSGEADSRRMEALLDSARHEMLTNMDYARAEALCQEVRSTTRNKLMRLMADEGLMKLCQIRSKNKEFHDYRQDAERLMGELRTAEQHMDPQGDSLWQVAQEEFRRVSAIYYYNLRDYDRAADLWPSLTDPNRQRGVLLAEYIGRQTFYYRSMRKKWAAGVLTDQGRYAEAMDSLAAALYLINEHHRRYSFTGQDDTLCIYGSTPDTASTEMRWIQTPDLVCVPEWMASVRDQLSITFGAMGLKAESDYNHNIYFDILDATRQDMLMEQQLDALERHERFFNILLIALAILSILIVGAALVTYRRRAAQALGREAQLRREITDELSRLPSRWQELSVTAVGQIEDQMEYVDDERRAAQMKIEQNKRGYVDKATSVSIAGGIQPFLDRALHEADRGFDRQYFLELIDKIIDYNEVLGHWVKIRQGSVSLTVESFPLEDLFAVVRKATRMYESSGLTLTVQQTDTVVKADKALTLFMINTLMDNARKFTPRGGTVAVSAGEGEDYVEISVADTGYGMTEEDTRDVVLAKKGHGYGLMNCRGIIEKYRKTNKLFSVCTFGVESRKDQGSRFYFRLPRVVRKALALLVVLLPFAQLWATRPQTDSPWLEHARVMADSVFYANTRADYLRAVSYGDSVIRCLNAHYTAMTHRTDSLLVVEGEANYMPEVRLWQEGFETDYGIIVDVRNELSIAALSLNRKQLYRYNSNVFTRMYQLLAQDETLSGRIDRLERVNADKGLVVNITVLLLLLFVPLVFVYYYNRHLLPIFNLQQVKALNERLLTTPAEQLPGVLLDGVSDIVPTDAICLAVFDGDRRQLQFRHARREEWGRALTAEADDTLQQRMNYASLGGEPVIEPQVRTVALPLNVDVGGDRRLVGVLGLRLHSTRLAETDIELLRWIAQSVAYYVYSTDTRIEELRHKLEMRQDELRRAEAELDRIHVQNMILDNCLSTIKHETMYYPNRIKDLLLREGCDDNPEARRDVSELIHYYKDIFTLLSQCAMKQLERTVFRRRPIQATQLLDYASERADHYCRHTFDGLTFTAGSAGSTCEADIQDGDKAARGGEETIILGDTVMLQYMLDTLLAAAYSVKECGEVSLDFAVSGQFCTFAFCDSRRHWTDTEMQTLFYADSLQYDPNEDRLLGAEYLLCRQIIREHDEHCGIRGCRIYATDGNTVIFTLPLKTK